MEYEKSDINDIEQEYERVLNTYDKDTLIMFLCDKLSIDEKLNFIKEFKN